MNFMQKKRLKQQATKDKLEIQESELGASPVLNKRPGKQSPLLAATSFSITKKSN
jgi:hypothetical protein